MAHGASLDSKNIVITETPDNKVPHLSTHNKVPKQRGDANANQQQNAKAGEVAGPAINAVHSAKAESADSSKKIKKNESEITQSAERMCTDFESLRGRIKIEIEAAGMAKKPNAEGIKQIYATLQEEFVRLADDAASLGKRVERRIHSINSKFEKANQAVALDSAAKKSQELQGIITVKKIEELEKKHNKIQETRATESARLQAIWDRVQLRINDADKDLKWLGTIAKNGGVVPSVAYSYGVYPILNVFGFGGGSNLPSQKPKEKAVAPLTEKPAAKSDQENTPLPSSEESKKISNEVINIQKSQILDSNALKAAIDEANVNNVYTAEKKPLEDSEDPQMHLDSQPTEDLEEPFSNLNVSQLIDPVALKRLMEKTEAKKSMEASDNLSYSQFDMEAIEADLQQYGVDLTASQIEFNFEEIFNDPSEIVENPVFNLNTEQSFDQELLLAEIAQANITGEYSFLQKYLEKIDDPSINIHLSQRIPPEVLKAEIEKAHSANF